MSTRQYIGALGAVVLSVTAFAGVSDVVKSSGIKGGIIVHLDCNDGKETAKLRINNNMTVQGLDTSRKDIDAARKYLAWQGLYGKVTANLFDGKKLPYADDLVNIIVSESATQVPESEILRVLCPLGTAFINGKKIVKPWPKEIDDWGHFLHGPDNNAVSSDSQVAPPKHLRWDAGPRWSRSHETDMSMTAMVSANGKLFYLIDDGPIGIHETPVKGERRLPDKSSLVARDAFNGLVLWKRPVPDWGTRSFKSDRLKWNAQNLMFSSPAMLPRRLVASGDRLYVTLGFNAPLSELDAVTGQTLRTFDGTADTQEILLADRTVCLHIRNAEKVSSVAALDLTDGKVKWQHKAGRISPVTLGVSGNKAAYFNGDELVVLNAADGSELWRAAVASGPAPVKDIAHENSVVVLHDNVVILVNKKVSVFSIEDGKKLWEKKGGFSTFRGKSDVFIAGGLLWLGANTGTGRDVTTGEVVKTLNTAGLFTAGHHTRCYRARATDNYLLWSKRGVEFMDIADHNHSKNDWVRSTCRYGVMPANGLLYTAPTPCFCYPGVKKNGFNAFSAADGSVADARRKEQEPEKGPAFDRIVKSKNVSPEDWPTYRHDNARSGYVKTTIPAKLEESWQMQLSGRVSPPVVAHGKLYVSEKDTHTIHCIDADCGKPVWRFIAGGSVDSPPTIHGGRVVFGCTDGRVYCLSAKDGQVAWTFQAAPFKKRIISYGKLQSSWPVHGSVLIENDIVYFAAGISSFLDGGIYMYGLDVSNGKIVHRARLDNTDESLKDAKTRAHDMDGAKNDILVSNGNRIFLTQNVFDMSLQKIETNRIGRYGALETDLHLVASGGFLDDSGFDRLYWMYAKRWPGLYFADKAPKAGQILVFDNKRTYGLHKFTKKFSRSPYYQPGAEGCELFADENDNEPLLAERAEKRERGTMSRAREPVWSVQVPVNARAMVLTDKILFFSGSPDVIPADDPLAALEERFGGKLWAVSKDGGEKLAEYDIASPPVFDGLIAASGKLYMVTRDGKVRCWE
jgi:outer membrane protein assembly factor BamB